MPPRSRRPCPHWPCPHLTPPDCPDHPPPPPTKTPPRPSASLRIYKSRRWQRLSHAWLRSHPLCARPRCNQPAIEVDHITPIEDGGAPYDHANLQGLCRAHHGEKTADDVAARTGSTHPQAPPRNAEPPPVRTRYRRPRT